MEGITGVPKMIYIGGFIMDSSHHLSNDDFFMARALEVTIRIGTVMIVFFWCFQIFILSAFERGGHRRDAVTAS